MTTPRMPRWTPLALTYLALALVGLVITFALNAWSVVAGRDYLGDIFGGGPAVGSIGVDLLVVAVAGCVLIVTEARRLVAEWVDHHVMRESTAPTPGCDCD